MPHNTGLLDTYSEIIRGASSEEIIADTSLNGSLLIERSGQLEILYAPFDYVNEEARIVLVGITPGRQQARNALLEMNRQLLQGANVLDAARAAKKFSSFSGPMRTNLVAMLDYFAVNRVLGLSTCAELFLARDDLVHFTSALRYPVYLGGENYNGSPVMTENSFLRNHLLTHFGDEVRRLSSAVFVPLGQKVTDAMLTLAALGLLERSRILEGLQHPSGANAERIAYLLERKPRAALSIKTRAQPIDDARVRLRARVSEWMGALSEDPGQTHR